MKNGLLIFFFASILGCADSTTPNESSDSQAAETTETSAAAQRTAEIAQSSIVTQELSYEVNGEQHTGFLAFDGASDAKRPGVLVVHEWWGHNDYVRDRAVQLAEMGYVALALDMYGSGKLAEHPDDAMAFMQAATADPAALQARFLAAKQLLTEHGATQADQVAAIGYCFGGAVVLNMARSGLDIDGVASFHGSLATPAPAEAGAVTAKVLVLHGEADPLVPPDQVAAFKAEMDAAGVDYEFVNYPEVLHGFTNPGATAKGEQFGLPLAYDEAADSDSWARLEMFFDEIWSDS